MTTNRKRTSRVSEIDQKTNDQSALKNAPLAKPPTVHFTAHQLQGGEKLIRLPELLRTVGISRATAYRYVANGILPKPIKLSPRCVAWKASAVNDWLAGLVAA